MESGKGASLLLLLTYLRALFRQKGFKSPHHFISRDLTNQIKFMNSTSESLTDRLIKIVIRQFKHMCL